MKSILTTSFLSLAFCLCFGTAAMAQLTLDTNSSPQDQSIAGDPSVDQQAQEEAVAQFRARSQKLNENKKRIDFLLRTMPIGFVNIKRERMEEIELLKAENIDLQALIYEQAFEVFAIEENPNPAALVIVMRELRSKLDASEEGSVFDPSGALEICNLLLKKDMANMSVLFDTFEANFALERFNEAGEILDKIVEMNPKLEDRIRPTLETAKENWQRELMIRRLESNTDDLPRVKLTTSEGEIVIELFENHAPNTVANFINLIQTSRFYDDNIFHLVKAGEFAATGSPKGDGVGGAGYQIECECYREQIRHHFRGSVSMLTANKDRGSSQFIITHQPNPIWDGNYTVFGRVIEGMDVLFKLKSVDMTRGVTAVEPSKLIRADVIRSRGHDYVPAKLQVTSSSTRPSIGQPGGSNTKQDILKEPGTFDLLLDQNKDK